LYNDYISWILTQIHLFWLLLLLKSHHKVDPNKEGVLLRLQYRPTVVQHVSTRILLKNITITAQIQRLRCTVLQSVLIWESTLGSTIRLLLQLGLVVFKQQLLRNCNSFMLKQRILARQKRLIIKSFQITLIRVWFIKLLFY
jgi:hypothetical protein